MLSNNKNLKGLLTGVMVVGVLLGAGLASVYSVFNTKPNDSIVSDEQQKPLYWVAPMDANYRRDQPGKSPMGMDLIPVYQETTVNDDFGPGVVKIAPHVINNLGVRTSQVEFRAMHSEISTVGYVQYDQDRLIHIHPRVDGWIEKLYVKAAGDPVAKGQALYTLYSPQLVNAQEEYLIALKRQNQPLISAAKDRLRALQLSSEFIDTLTKTAKVQQTVTFYSPQAGVVDGLKIREGFYVKPGNTLMSIGQLEQVWVEAEVFERDAILIKQGLSVVMTLGYIPGQQWQGVVDYIYPTLNSKTRTLRVRLKFDNADLQLKPNMFAQIAIQAPQSEKVILVPKESVIRTGKQDRVVLALGDGQFKSIAVTLGRVGKEYIEIITGLTEQDVVVTSAQFLIDSESSKSSDFSRMAQDEQSSSVWMQGILNSLPNDHRMVNISHQPVNAWQWPAMTMDFIIKNNIDITTLHVGQTLDFQVINTPDGDYKVIDIRVVAETEDQKQTPQSATVDGRINRIDATNRLVNISREAIEKWRRPAATMDFLLADDLDITHFNKGDLISFTFEVSDELIITAMALKHQQQPNADEHATHK